MNAGIPQRRRKCGTGVETKERVRGALRTMGFRSSEAERAGTMLARRGGTSTPIEILVREAIGVIT